MVIKLFTANGDKSHIIPEWLTQKKRFFETMVEQWEKCRGGLVDVACAASMEYVKWAKMCSMQHEPELRRI